VAEKAPRIEVRGMRPGAGIIVKGTTIDYAVFRRRMHKVSSAAVNMGNAEPIGTSDTGPIATLPV
jgi:hypothetical protein